MRQRRQAHLKILKKKIKAIQSEQEAHEEDETKEQQFRNN